MIRNACCYILFAFGISFSLITFAASTSIISITPNRIPFNKDSTIIISGRKMGIIKGCAVFPVTGNNSVATIQTGSYCTATPNRSGSQLIVTIGGNGLPVAGTYNLILATAAIKQGTDLPTALASTSVVQIANIYTFDPASSAPSSVGTNGTTSSGGGTEHPYTDCLGLSNGPGAVGNSTAPSTNVLCSSSVMPDGEVSDNFGKHVSQLYSAIQVRVSNKNSQYDFLLRDVVLTLPDGRVTSSRIRRFAQGVAVKGKTRDPRSIIFNSLTAAGGVYGALASFGSAAFTTAGNVFQGSFMAAYNQIFPDYTADNVNRFNNSVFDDQNPSIVPKDSIGQPPLFVVVLVPKEPHMGTDASYQGAKNILVSIEGTFIKQVTLLSLSKSALSFQPQFISPPKFTKPLFDFTDLVAVSESQQFSISNTGSTSLNIHSFSVVPSGGAKGASSPDFDVDTKASNCGVGGGSVTPSTGTSEFTVAPNASCVIAIRFHPTTIGQINATLTLSGDNLEGTSAVTLSGTGVGLIMQATDTAVPSVSHTFGNCSYSNASTCTFDLGSQNAGNAASVNVYYYTGNTTDKLTVGTNPVTSFTSLGNVPGAGAAPTPSGILKVPVAAGASSTALSFMDETSAFKTPLTVTFNYQTVATTLTTSIAAGAAIQYGSKATVLVGPAVGGKYPTGQLSYTVTTQGTPSVTAIPKTNASIDPSSGIANIDLSTLPPGSYAISINFAGTGIYQDSPLDPISFTIANPMAILLTPPAAVTTHGSPASVVVKITPPPAAIQCSGTYTAEVVSALGSKITTSATPDTVTGNGNVTFTPPSAGNYTVTVTYSPNTGSVCPAQSPSVTVIAN